MVQGTLKLLKRMNNTCEGIKLIVSDDVALHNS